MKDVILFPFGGNARESVTAILALNSVEPTWNILGFIDDNSDLYGKECCGFKVLGSREKLYEYHSAKILAVPGNPGNFLMRREIISQLGVARDRFIVVIDPSCRIATDSDIGVNTLIMGNVTISCSVVIGDHCVILPNTVISHDSKIEEFSLIGSNVSISGSCSVGSNCYIGSGSRIRENVKIGSCSLIGMGSCVINDVPGSVTVAGNPARVLGKMC